MVLIYAELRIFNWIPFLAVIVLGMTFLPNLCRLPASKDFAYTNERI
jgi:hypothetical protein